MINNHLSEHGLSYFQHQKLAFFFAFNSFKVWIMAFVHWVFPFLFKTSASELHKKIMPKYINMLELYKMDFIKYNKYKKVSK